MRAATGLLPYPPSDTWPQFSRAGYPDATSPEKGRSIRLIACLAYPTSRTSSSCFSTSGGRQLMRIEEVGDVDADLLEQIGVESAKYYGGELEHLHIAQL